MADESPAENIQDLTQRPNSGEQLTVRELARIQLLKYHIPSDRLIKYVVNGMSKELNLGLSHEDEATVKCFFTYVSDRPSGEEQGTVLALDLGGTNFRTLMIELPSGKELAQKTVKIAEELMTGTGSKLFDFIAKELIDFVVNYANEMKQKVSGTFRLITYH